MEATLAATYAANVRRWRGHVRCCFAPTTFGQSKDTASLTEHTVYFLPRQRVLLRDRRGVPNRPLQPHGPKHRSTVLPVCARPRNRRLRLRLRR